MKTQIITLVSHYNKIGLNLRINANCAEILKTLDYPIGGIINDLDRLHYHYPLVYLSESQAKKVANFFAKGNIDYFDNVIFQNH